MKDFLDWPFFEDRHRALGESLDRWCDAYLTDDEPDDLDQACRDLVRKLGDGGWLRHCVPDGSGRLDVRTLALIRETLARHCGLADFAFAMQGLGSGTISLFGSDAQKAAYLPAVAAGEKTAAFALSEPDAGSDAAALAMAARDDGDAWVLDGTKTWISNGGIADFYVVFARTGEAPGSRGISAFIVDADTSGLEIAERIDVIAPHPLAR
ncbi:MAG TPA: acyl-CoA dehydrogenase family protein, partial [Allosphingosinicella sp.]